MKAEHYATLMIEVAQLGPIYDDPNAIDEAIYFLMWHLWDELENNPENDPIDENEVRLARIELELHRLRTGFTIQECRKRSVAYAEAKNNNPEPALHIARVFQTCITPPLLEAPTTLLVSKWLAALTDGLQAGLVTLERLG